MSDNGDRVTALTYITLLPDPRRNFTPDYTPGAESAPD